MTRRDGRGRRSERGGEVRGKDDCRRGCRFPGCVLCDLGSGRVLVCRPESAGGVFRWVGGRSQRGLDWGGVVFVFGGGLEEWIEGEGGGRGKGNRNETGGEKATDRGDGTSEPRLY